MNNKILRIAVASKEGQAISEHFGHAKHFHIYDVQKNHCHFVEQRNVDHYCLGGHSDKNALAGILETISDCQSVFVAKIGDGPTEKLKTRGIDAISEYAWDEIEPSLLDYAAKVIS
jgi:predicted Fe-Mo cluster-binding NifX family protein